MSANAGAARARQDGADDTPPRPLLERWDDFERSRAEWSALAHRAGNVFATWEWADAWRRHLGHAGSPRVFASRAANGTPSAILPLWLAAARPLRVLRFIGHGPADQLGPICAPGGEAEAARALARALVELAPGWDVLLAEQLPGAAPWGELLGGRMLRRECSPAVPIAGRSWEEYLASRSSNLRQQIRRRERQLARAHAVRYRLALRPERLQHDLDLLFSLHALRWGAAASRALDPARRAFHRDFAARALERGWLRLWFLEVDGTAVAAWYGFRFAGAEWYYQSGRDPAWDAASVGFVLLAHTLRAAFEDGLREYRLLRGPETYKWRFAMNDAGLSTVAVGRGARGRAGVPIAAAAAARPAVARMLRLAVGGAR